MLGRKDRTAVEQRPCMSEGRRSQAILEKPIECPHGQRINAIQCALKLRDACPTNHPFERPITVQILTFEVTHHSLDELLALLGLLSTAFDTDYCLEVRLHPPVQQEVGRVEVLGKYRRIQMVDCRSGTLQKHVADR